jgi:hypothetical protein
MILLCREHIFKLELFNQPDRLRKLLVHFFFRGFTGLLEIKKYGQIIHRTLHFQKCIGPVFFLFYLFKDLLGTFRVVPKVRRMCKLFFLSDLLKSVIDVKDASSEHQHDRKFLLAALVT